VRVTDAFLGEHGVFYALFEKLEEQLGPEATAPELAGAAQLLCDSLVSHAKLEEELLFRALERAGEGTEPLGAMHDEHVEIERQLALATRALVSEDAARALAEAIELAREHFLKEEEILFPMAARLLPPAELEALGARWSAARGVRLVID